MPIRKRYGSTKDPIDRRDLLLAAAPIVVEAPLPTATFNRHWVLYIKDQGDTGSCTGQRTAAQLSWLRFRYRQEGINFSAMFAYDMERMLEGTPLDEDAGANPRSGCRVIAKYGLCLESQMPYVDKQYMVPPTQAQIQDALPYQGCGYHRLRNLSDLKHCMASLPGFPGYTSSFGFDVPESFESDEVAKTGLLPMPRPDENMVGGHDMHAVDYDDSIWCPNAPSPGAVLCQNSWGEDWGCDPGIGKRGFVWVPYAAIPQLVSDMWMVHLGAAWAPPARKPGLTPGLAAA